ncbi:Uncharacterized protein C4orf37 like protein [Trachymyrmex zeteki]|uniref:Uncharacterized protein C4orf37 like protein n=1 Tax=Mycetomoellerius zeteki TaxID=64791 RepID=A0A151X1E8_9HYME|nr:Uncharacterized protein C4orf37 like protein [Trachymyrmex zeteki]
MAFDRTERFVEIATSTSAQVGPGTYDISDPSKPARHLGNLYNHRLHSTDNAYPFLRGASKQTLGIPKDVHKFNNLQGGVSLDYTDVRFKEKMCERPSPTQYILPNDLFKETPRKIKSHPGTWHGSAGKLWLIPPPRPLTTSLAVPSKRDIGGYDYNERGVLVKNPVIEHKPTDFYDVPRGCRVASVCEIPRERLFIPQETNFTALKYKGNFWSRMKGRDDERTSVTPGPGDYEHETKKSPVQIRDERTREAKRAAAKQPRFLEALYQQKLRQNRLMKIYFFTKNFPAPNHYDLPKSVFDKYKHILCKCGSFMVESPPFNQSAKRFEENFQSDTLGPGTYEITVPQICYGSILHAPFGAFDDRFKRIIEEVLPGPADYHTDIGTLAFESAKRLKNKHEKMFDYIKFCKTLPSISDDDEYMVMDECQVMMKVDEGKCPVYHAVFKSRVDRFPKIRKNGDVPDSGAYEVLSAFKANRDRCDFLCRRLAPPFGSRASRFPMIPEGDFHVPGPAHYDLRGDISKNVKNGVIYSAPREKKMDVKGPGPFHYHVKCWVTINEANLMAYADRNMRTATINQFGITDYHCGYHALLAYTKVRCPRHDGDATPMTRSRVGNDPLISSPNRHAWLAGLRPESNSADSCLRGMSPLIVSRECHSNKKRRMRRITPQRHIRAGPPFCRHREKPFEMLPLALVRCEGNDVYHKFKPEARQYRSSPDDRRK